MYCSLIFEEGLMTDNERENGEGTLDKSVSRRDFLKIAGMAGAAVGLGVGLGGVIAACGGTEETTTSSAAGTSATTGATGGETTTSASASAESGGEIKAGYVIPVTGAMAAFGAAGQWQLDWMNKNIWKDGLVCGDGKKYKITAKIYDSQSDSNRSSQVTSDAILNEGVSLIGASSSAANVIPVAAMADSLECPGIHYDVPGDAWADAQKKAGGAYKWNWCSWWVGKDLVSNFFKMWELVPNNKVVGALWVNDADGNVFRSALPDIFKAQGYTLIDPGPFEVGTEDFSAVISKFKSGGVELVCGMANPAEFTNYVTQSAQQSFKPKITTCAKALLFPSAVDALGDLGDGMTVEAWYHPKYAYKSDVTGMTAQQYCDDFEATTGQQWTQPICFIGCFELWTDVLKRTKNPLDKSSIVEAIKGTKVTLTGGPVDWTVNPEPKFNIPNFCAKPLGGGQWVKDTTGKHKYSQELVASVTDPDNIPVTATMKEMQYSS
jgi:branched-chain amino acid transport system substrate-binding protein